MSSDRSNPWIGALGALGALLAGLVALYLTVSLARPHGVRGALLLGELALATPALLVAALFGLWGALWGPPPDWRTVGWRAVAAGAALWLSSLGLLDVQARLWQPPPGYLDAFRALHELLRPRDVGEALFSLAAIALGPALGEELVFRGLLLPAVQRCLGNSAALIASSLLFAAIHLDPTAGGLTAYRVPFALVAGLGFGWLRLRAGTLAAPMLAHATLNSLTFAAVPWLDDPGRTTTTGHPALAMVLLAAGAAAMLALLRRWPGGGATSGTSSTATTHTGGARGA